MDQPPSDETDRIEKAYETDNMELRERVKVLEEQLGSGEPRYKAEVENLRRQVWEMQNAQESGHAYERLECAYKKLSEEAKERELELLDELESVRSQNVYLQENSLSLWDEDQTKNDSIVGVLKNMRQAYTENRDLGKALEDVAAIIAPDFLVKRDAPPSPGPQRTRGVANTRLAAPSRGVQNEEMKRLREELDALKAQINAKPASQPRRTGIPSRIGAAPQATQKVKELEVGLADAEQRCGTAQQEVVKWKGLAKERLGKVNELTQQLQASRDEMDMEKRRRDNEAVERAAEKESTMAKLKELTEDGNFRVECGKLKTRVAVLEAENEELRKPRPTGVAALDRVLDALSRMEGDIQQRKSDLGRKAMELEDRFEKERREIEHKHRVDIESRNDELRRLKENYERIFADLEKSKTHRHGV